MILWTVQGDDSGLKRPERVWPWNKVRNWFGVGGFGGGGRLCEAHRKVGALLFFFRWSPSLPSFCSSVWANSTFCHHFFHPQIPIRYILGKFFMQPGKIIPFLYWNFSSLPKWASRRAGEFFPLLAWLGELGVGSHDVGLEKDGRWRSWKKRRKKKESRWSNTQKILGVSVFALFFVPSFVSAEQTKSHTAYSTPHSINF